MSERNNTEKSIKGNKTEKSFLERLTDSKKLKFSEKPQKNRYCTNKHEDAEYDFYKEPDVVFTLESHQNIECICEYTISSREDRMSGKQYQAELVKAVLKRQKKGCIYTVVVPDDDYYNDSENAKTEIANNNRTLKKINEQLVLINHIDFLLKESQVEEFFAEVQKCKSQNPTYIIKKMRTWLNNKNNPKPTKTED